VEDDRQQVLDRPEAARLTGMAASIRNQVPGSVDVSLDILHNDAQFKSIFPGSTHQGSSHFGDWRMQPGSIQSVVMFVLGGG
jgi:hypothetical protein